MRVLKFGGTSVADPSAIARVAAIVGAAHRTVGTCGPAVVVSALGGVTDRLLEVARLARNGDASQAHSLVASLRDRHLEVLTAVAGRGAEESRRFLEEQFDRLAAVADALAVLREASPRSLDTVASVLLVTDDTFTCAVPQLEATRAHVQARVRPLIAEGGIPVTGGFVGATRGGVATTLGRGGSDYSAAILSAALDAEEIQIWTDVDGMLTADPRVVSSARLVPFLSFAEAAELAYFGARVLHPKTIQPAASSNIPVRILNTFRPDAPGTLITDLQAPEAAPVTALASRGGITVITITSSRMLMAHGFLRRLFEVFERHQTSVDVVSTSEVSVSVTIDDLTHLDAIVAGLSAFAEVSVAHRLALVAVVGDRFAAEPAAFGRVIAALEGIPLRLVSQADSRRNVTLVIDEEDVTRAMDQLHEAFFGSAVRTSEAAQRVSA
jgi:aspartate kinase